MRTRIRRALRYLLSLVFFWRRPPADLERIMPAPSGNGKVKIAIPTILVQKRAGEIGNLLRDARIPPDAATIVALEQIHDSLVAYGHSTGWLLDTPVPEGQVH